LVSGFYVVFYAHLGVDQGVYGLFQVFWVKYRLRKSLHAKKPDFLATLAVEIWRIPEDNSFVLFIYSRKLGQITCRPFHQLKKNNGPHQVSGLAYQA
jgi:heme/copper-type cytochrome/quinol oxidase subunit 2